MYCIVKDNLFLVYVVKMLGGEGGCSKFIIFPLKFNDILPLSHSLSVVSLIFTQYIQGIYSQCV
jgi:hypothetical protein